MPHDVFISYSRKDSAEAIALAKRLRAEAIDVWIDQRGIGGAKRWATEIAGAIRECSSFVLLVSENAVTSQNVLREVTLASNRGKRLLPVILRQTSIPVSLEYHLAGIHYLHYSAFEEIVSSIKGPMEQVPSGTCDTRKSILVLPFEDLSPNQDNGWFADGLTSELISTLSKIKSLRVIDWNTSKDFKGARGHTRDIARDLDVRFFLEGNVRKFGDQIKISAELLDIKTGEYLWHDSHKGIFADIFEIQEQVATKVAVGLELTLSPEEQKRVAERGTENIEAYERFLKARHEYFLWSREHMEQSLELVEEVVRLDPAFASALRLEAMVHLNLYRLWDRNPEHLTRAESLFQDAERMEPDIKSPYIIYLYILQKRFADAEQFANQFLEGSANDFYDYFLLGFFYFNVGRLAEAAKAYEKAIPLRHEDRIAYWNLVEVLDRARELDSRTRWSKQALPLFQKWAVLHPEDQFAQAQLGTFQLYAGLTDVALATISSLCSEIALDGLTRYTISVFFLHVGNHDDALRELDRAIDAGFSHIELLTSDPNFEPVLNSAEYQRIIEKIKEKA